MSSELELCLCTSAKTRRYIQDNSNICPECRKLLIEEDLYLQPVPKLEKEDKDPEINQLITFLREATFGSIKNRPQEVIRLKPPNFSGENETDVKHYFLKLENYFAAYNIVKEDDKIRVIKQTLDNVALDLFISLDPDIQADFSALEKIFLQYFKPKKHDVLEMGELLKLNKLTEESVSEFLLRLRKKAEGLFVSEEMIKAIFINGLNTDFQRHIALQKAVSMDEIFETACEFEKITKFADERKTVGFVNIMESNKSDDVKTLTEMMSEILQRLDRLERNQEVNEYDVYPHMEGLENEESTSELCIQENRDGSQGDYQDTEGRYGNSYQERDDDRSSKEESKFTNVVTAERSDWQKVFDMMEEILHYVRNGIGEIGLQSSDNDVDYDNGEEYNEDMDEDEENNLDEENYDPNVDRYSEDLDSYDGENLDENNSNFAPNYDDDDYHGFDDEECGDFDDYDRGFSR